jgi:PAS domain-containing protein
MPPAQPFLFEEGSPFRALFDAMSALVFIVDRDYVVHDANLAAVRALGPGPSRR